jgi:CO/xanthine dehydrogenase FAD-binding subunit
MRKYRMYANDFSGGQLGYHQPLTLTQALHIAADPRMRMVAGGTDLFPSLGDGPAPAHLLDLTRVAGLRGITSGPEGWRIGAATRWADLVQAHLPPAFAGVQAAAREVGSVQIQNAGTIGGNLCTASPAADGVPALLTLDAVVELASVAGIRRIALQDFLLGARKTASRADEILTAIHIPPLPDAQGAFLKLGARRYLVISIAMVAVVLGVDAHGLVTTARIAVGSCAPVAQRLRALEADLIGHTLRDVQVRAHHLGVLNPIGDVRGSADYRLDAVTTLVQRALQVAHG